MVLYFVFFGPANLYAQDVLCPIHLYLKTYNACLPIDPVLCSKHLKLQFEIVMVHHYLTRWETHWNVFKNVQWMLTCRSSVMFEASEAAIWNCGGTSLSHKMSSTLKQHQIKRDVRRSVFAVQPCWEGKDKFGFIRDWNLSRKQGFLPKWKSKIMEK